MNRHAFTLFMLVSLAAVAQETPGPGDRTTASTQQPAPGPIFTPTGILIFPNAPPPAGDTSTLSGAGPSVSEGPVVGSGPEISAGPVVGTGP
jgi:hypothetical protein